MPDIQDANLQPSDRDVAAARHGLDQGAIGGNSLAIMAQYGPMQKGSSWSVAPKPLLK
ncbi:hypothetical protein DSO57_1016620 [Entomophthora muscae]|uniref:Uncharacterized protein n=1 Tax=Entomophthora muscae TaxID=34485 RepID=A0ACC2T4R9_9FUNG|nr:hypothetical protein DSO57_1016620 [Entomophthora muscae]